MTHFLVAQVQEYRTSTEAARQIGIENDGGVGRRTRRRRANGDSDSPQILNGPEQPTLNCTAVVVA